MHELNYLLNFAYSKTFHRVYIAICVAIATVLIDIVHIAIKNSMSSNNHNTVHG